uniref:Uncharacterized protein n=1 Tax=Chromera velia CCMP2878 TaxID=1169474 RepID=A0A0G4FI23_9ALVE|eukprot:Cvel_3366.t1-p1 / transcript=Cvel_3366.t1 / gene=Cvel_3366 / organism=Chromera_velia_CCMP2878 / gene_product=hypothetical protein / transcript_product=hypothetical protein / location=Cvel_scaffold134:109786-111679(-) / protein_length=123 / sequence_SO=supercontig / SO=protein_coding / is_pseudo=false
MGGHKGAKKAVDISLDKKRNLTVDVNSLKMQHQEMVRKTPSGAPLKAKKRLLFHRPSRRPVVEILTVAAVRDILKKEIRDTAETFHISEDEAEVLMVHFRFDRERLEASWFDDLEGTRMRAKL